MLKVIEYGVWVIAAVFVLLTAGLAYWNWNQQLKEKVLSGVLLAAGATLVLVYAGLREETVRGAFRVSIAVDDRTHLPAFYVDLSRSRLGRRQTELSGLAVPRVHQQDEEQNVWYQAPTDASGTRRLCLDLLQYAIVKTVLERQRETVLLAHIQGGAAVFEDGVHAPYRPTRTDVLQTTAFPARYPENRFFSNPVERHYWEYGQFRVPQRLTIDLGYRPAAEGLGPERTTVTLRKPLFFEAAFSVEPQGSTAAAPALDFPEEQRPYISTHVFLVELNARFEKYRSRHWEMDEYRRWVDWTYTQLKTKMSDAS